MNSKLLSTIWEVWGEPLLTSLNILPDRKHHDYTYGRYKIPFSSMEKRMHSDPEAEVWFGNCQDEDGFRHWYQVWTKPQSVGTGKGKDLLFSHGTGVHSGTFASHARRYLDAGFRLIVPDLPGHGYSSHLHVYVPEMSMYTKGLHAVLHDVNLRDDCLLGRRRSKSERNETFILGLSFGGLVAIYYGHMYPTSLREAIDGQDEVPIDGIIGVGPMIGYSKDSIKMHPVIQNAIRTGVSFLQAGRLELIVPHKKSVDRDPKVYAKLVSEDPRSHQGAFRAAHLVCIDDAMKFLEANVKSFKHPLLIQQGGQDRVADTNIAFNYLTRTSTKKEDKSFWIYPVCQHVIYRKAKTEEEDKAGRVVVIGDNVEWMKNKILARKLKVEENEKKVVKISRTESWTSGLTLVEEENQTSDSYLESDSEGSETDVSESERGSFFGSEVESESEGEEFSLASFHRRDRHQLQPFQLSELQQNQHAFNNLHPFEVAETPRFSKFVRKSSSSNLSKKHTISPLSISTTPSNSQLKSLNIFSPSLSSPIPTPTPRQGTFSNLIMSSNDQTPSLLANADLIVRATTPLNLNVTTPIQLQSLQPLKAQMMTTLMSPSPNSKYHFNLSDIQKVSYLDHPLTAKAHHSTLPRISRDFGDRKVFRKKWSLHDALRPYELAVDA